jgi:beta-galactosidase
MNSSFSLFLLLSLGAELILSSCSKTVTRSRSDFGESWKFSLSSDTTFIPISEFDDAGWRTLNLPHDWSIEGEFSETNPATPGGGALPGGIGWYRKSFVLPGTDSSKMIYIDFDGVYRNSEVWINGQYLGKRPYGYSSFRYKLSPYLYYGNKTNILTVKVDNSKQPNSRWYSGSGIYRNVWLVKTGKVHVDHWGTQIITPEVSEKNAIINISTTIQNTTSYPLEGTLETTIIDQHGKSVLKQKAKFDIRGESTTLVQQDFSLDNPVLWTLENPSMYKAVNKVFAGKSLVDEFETPFGLRSFVFDRDNGFILNGKKTKILGVCNHHDLGCLGAAVNTRAIERQLEILKAMGCNAIRTSHNPPAPELLDLCDKLGFIVMDEAFDMWKKKKTANDYSFDWDDWHKRDLQDMVRRDRNHPSVMIWSIGNEILEQWDSTGITIARELAGYVKELDISRPITSACNETKPINNIIKSGALDLIGFNYHQDEFPDFLSTYSKGVFIGSETTSALATRGYYEMKSDSIRRWPDRWDIPFKANPDNTCSSYDNCSTPWGSTHEESWRIIKKYDFLSGLFIWTGFDYLGEPTPYGWPSRSSYFGIIDLAGFPKDAYYMYQSEWTQVPVMHLFPHWNWTEGDSVDMWVYSNCPEVELFLNGNSLGKKTKGKEDLHLQWRVKYSPGEVKAVGMLSSGENISDIVKTAGKPARIELAPDRNMLSADGKDLSFITVRILDKDGILVPDSDNRVKFTLKGDGILAGVDNGDPVSHESFKADSRKAFHGLCLAVVQAGKTSGKIEVLAESEGLSSGTVSLITK